jgi:REP element-mobilizing transposase RayT
MMEDGRPRPSGISFGPAVQTEVRTLFRCVGAIDSRMQRKYEYRRKLPHYQPDFKAFFITFSTYRRWILPESVRQMVIDTCLAGNGRNFALHALVVMPDHVHIVLTPKYDVKGPISIAEIMQAIKSSQHTESTKLLGGREKSGRRSHSTGLFAGRRASGIGLTTFWGTLWELGSHRIHWSIVGCGGTRG